MSGRRPPRVVRVVRAVRRLRLRLSAPGRVTYGEGFVVGPSARVARTASLELGSRVSIGADMTCQVRLVVGDDVMISSSVAFIGDDHPFDSSRRTIQEFASRPPSSVRLVGDNLIGHGTIIVGPARIGRGTIVGAGSVVTGDLPPDMICYGVPAVPRRVRRDGHEQDEGGAP